MGAEHLNPLQAASTGHRPAWLELLHREAEGDLAPQERAELETLTENADVQAARAALAHITGLLSTLDPPEMPGSVAAVVAHDIGWSLQLEPPSLPNSVAAQVASDIAYSRQLSPPLLPQSVAAAVASSVRVGAVLSVIPPLPRSIAANVMQDIQASRWLTPPTLPRSLAAEIASDVAASARLGQSLPPAVPSVAVQVTARIAAPPLQAAPVQTGRVQTVPSASTFIAQPIAPLIAQPQASNPAPLLLVSALLVGLILLAITSAWPNLAAGALVMQTLLAQVSPLAGVGLALLLVTSALVAWRPRPTVQRFGAAAFALSAILTVPAMFGMAGRSGVTFGQNVTVSGPVAGNVIAVGGQITLTANALVRGEVVTLLGDVRREPGAQVTGRVNALLGRAPGDRNALQTPPPVGLGMATAAAFRPVLGWLGAAAWPQVFLTLTGGVLLLLFVGGMAPALARRQRHAPVRTLALGVLALAALIGPAFGLALAGMLGPALIATALAALLIATGLSVSVYDLGRAVAYRVRLPVPDAVGALVGLSSFAACLSAPTLAFVLALIGGTWGAGTLLLTRGQGAAKPEAGWVEAA
ncbi:polymer-forming cytoskeletal protein [Deinococcus sp. QL22]|uniref:polymer-forming cytoskeletal protein n=1 Tax=Deinococcus sp. QL22 TaxID=2939437 RepID=UPI00201734FD|nr:polymer-forming cytoskeletal protein [Deinococcus sp. QL22]UQN07689.1 polymer-forming cytoskeletal protein [Deinococcus sp. QL22]